MLEMTKKLYDEMDEMMKVCMNKTFTAEMLAYMDVEEVQLIQACFKLYDSAKDLAIKQAEIIEEQNKKLDKILSKLSNMEMRSL